MRKGGREVGKEEVGRKGGRVERKNMEGSGVRRKKVEREGGK